MFKIILVNPNIISNCYRLLGKSNNLGSILNLFFIKGIKSDEKHILCIVCSYSMFVLLIYSIFFTFS